ncbi:MAG: putative membrane protein/mono/diheme cytochrome c family protein [Rhodothermales bacterium]|jgi:uncharacterized membrane protein/mono/diheme cytochrome c family protein
MTHPPGYVYSTKKMEVSQRFALLNLVGVVIVTALLLLLLDPAARPSSAGLFLGRFHPALVHLPIGLLALAIGLDVATRLGRCTMEWARWVYVAGSWAGVAALTAGLWLAQAGGYDADTLFLHRLTAILATVGAAALPWVQSLSWSRGTDTWALLGTAAVAAGLTVAGHQGGSLTHGPEFLTAHAPAFVQTVLGGGSPSPALALGDPDTTSVYRGIVRPILNDRCTSCHGAGRVRGGLDLTSHAAIMDGGDDGTIVIAGRPSGSVLIARVLLPEAHQDKMPPEGSQPLSPSDARLLAWWVESGADSSSTLSSATIPADVRAILDAHGLGAIRTGVWALDLGEADPTAVEALRSLGAVVSPVAQDEALLSVRCPTRAACFGDGGLALSALAQKVVWLDLARSDVTDEDLSLLRPLIHLERVWLQKTQISNLGTLGEAVYLDYLNVSETAVTEDALGAVSHVKNVYSWGSLGSR